MAGAPITGMCQLLNVVEGGWLDEYVELCSSMASCPGFSMPEGRCDGRLVNCHRSAECVLPTHELTNPNRKRRQPMICPLAINHRTVASNHFVAIFPCSTGFLGSPPSGAALAAMLRRNPDTMPAFGEPPNADLSMLDSGLLRPPVAA